MQAADVRKNIQQMKFAPVYVLYGTEPFLIDEMRQAILDHALEKETFEFNFAEYDMEETPVESAIEDAETLPFLGEYRVIVIKNPYFLTGKNEKKKIEHDLAKLERYIDAPSPSTVLVFTGDYEKLDQRKKIVKKLKKIGEMMAFSTADEKVIYRLLRERADLEGAVFTQEANEHLLHLTGPHLFHLVSEVDKMALYVGEQGEITAEVVDLLCAKTLESNVFSLVDKVVLNKLDEAFAILDDLMKQNEEPIKLLALLGRQFRIIFRVKHLQESGYTQGHMAKRLKLHPYAVKIASGQGRSFEKADLLRILNDFTETDYMMKTGKMDKRLALEMLLTNIRTT
ncbi:MAG TPA: DNA polymerase III subunit delta [Bacillales bacterium]|nr:DNA polymerase III subunit delta [Bacillales bacterium]